MQIIKPDVKPEWSATGLMRPSVAVASEALDRLGGPRDADRADPGALRGDLEDSLDLDGDPER